MSQVTTQKKVMAGLDRMNGRRVGKIAKAYDRAVNAPARVAIGKAKSLAGLRKALSARLARAMDTTALAGELEAAFVQSGAIGAVSATPKGKRRNVKTSKRRNVQTSKAGT